MLNDAVGFKQVYIVCGYTDLRSGIDSLASLLETKMNVRPYILWPQDRSYQRPGVGKRWISASVQKT